MPNNPETPNKSQNRPPSIDQIARAIEDLGIPHPLLVDAAREAVNITQGNDVIEEARKIDLGQPIAAESIPATQTQSSTFLDYGVPALLIGAGLAWYIARNEQRLVERAKLKGQVVAERLRAGRTRPGVKCEESALIVSSAIANECCRVVVLLEETVLISIHG